MTVGKQRDAFYLNLIKNLFNKNLHEVIELHGFGDRGIVKLTNVMRALINYRYC